MPNNFTLFTLRTSFSCSSFGFRRFDILRFNRGGVFNHDQRFVAKRDRRPTLDESFGQPFVRCNQVVAFDVNISANEDVVLGNSKVVSVVHSLFLCSSGIA